MERRMTERYLEDFAVGQIFGSGRLSVDADQIKAFAAEFDPQPFHLDEKAANDTFFHGLAASGWHTAALTMRLLVEGDLKLAGGIVGAGAKSLGRGRCAPATSSATKAKCSKCARPNRALNRVWSN
jgi:acyl dehydratase